jgi:hypothetical protein
MAMVHSLLPLGLENKHKGFGFIFEFSNNKCSFSLFCYVIFNYTCFQYSFSRVLPRRSFWGSQLYSRVLAPKVAGFSTSNLHRACELQSRHYSRIQILKYNIFNFRDNCLSHGRWRNEGLLMR